MQFYTNVTAAGNILLYRGFSDGKRIHKRIEYKPTLFVPAEEPSGLTTIKGQHVAPMDFENIREAREFVDRYSDVEDFDVYGNTRFEYVFLGEHFPQEVIDWDRSLVSVANIDIEVGSAQGFPSVENAVDPVVAITVQFNDGDFYVFACGPWEKSREGVRYVRCADEKELLEKFLETWASEAPDVVTGWYVKFFDIPYLVRRMVRLLGEKVMERLSPWKKVWERNVSFHGRDHIAYQLLGVSILDYIELYDKFAPQGKSQESYKLDAIAAAELGTRKVSFDEYETLHKMYLTDHQRFIDYNIVDVELVGKLDAKLKLIDLALTLAYDAKVNYEDCFSQVRMWDAICHNALMAQDIVVPQNTRKYKSAAYDGAYVKAPQVGMHKWVVSFDLNSLYPHLIMQYNISPDTFMEAGDYGPEIHSIITSGQTISVDNLLKRACDITLPLQIAGATLTPNGQFFRTDKTGFLATIMQRMYDDRSKYKNLMIAAKKSKEAEDDPVKKTDWDKIISRYNNLQLAKKVTLNSAYGALGNQYFRFFDVRQAEAVTTSGQLSIRWVGNHMNAHLNEILKTSGEDYIIASDTDSLYLNLGPLVEALFLSRKPHATTVDIVEWLDKVCDKILQREIDSCFRELAQYVNVHAQKMEMKRESIADKGIWTAKKRYILNVWNEEGVAYKEPKIKISGIEAIKSSTPSACRAQIKKGIEIIVRQDNPKLLSFIEDFRSKFPTLSVGEIACPRGMNGLEKYKDADKSVPMHVRGALVYNRLLVKHKLTDDFETVKDGEKIKYVYLREPNPANSHVLSFINTIPEKLGLVDFIDYDMQFEKNFIQPLKAITDAIGWHTEEVSSLEEFFS